jgi:hypothetical protein
MSLFRKKSDVPEEQAMLAAMDDIRNRPKDPPDLSEITDEAESPGSPESPRNEGDEESGDARPGVVTSAGGGPLLDFGSVKVPAVDGMQLRVEIDEQENPVAVTVMLDDTQLQVQAFAAPRSESLWDEVRQEIAEGIRGGQGKARETDGPFGRELQAEVVVADPQGKTARQPVRFVGIDGDRWFLRGLITGAGATDPPRAEQVEAVFAGVEVERGGHAAAPRDPLEIVVPQDPALVAQPDQQEEDPSGPQPGQ